MSDSNDLYFLSNAFPSSKLFPDSDSEPVVKVAEEIATPGPNQIHAKVNEYRGYTLDCTPRLMHFGQWASRVTIRDSEGKECFALHKYGAIAYPWTEQEAITIARDYGVKWINENR
ncbi:hypothetical protein [Paraburkholderia caledonica]|uniref:hypothetical protein n=1 Tax=Paraburkholderia caledonica TaxID=134536 RepID=UPI0038B8200E